MSTPNPSESDLAAAVAVCEAAVWMSSLTSREREALTTVLAALASLEPLRAAAERAEKAELDRVWEELKRIGCSNPETAVRVIMVTKEMLSSALRAAEALLQREEAKPTGFYTKHSEHGWQTLGFAWVDKQGDYRQIEGKTLEADPLMAAHFMESFAQGMIKRIRDNVDKR